VKFARLQSQTTERTSGGRNCGKACLVRVYSCPIVVGLIFRVSNSTSSSDSAYPRKGPAAEAIQPMAEAEERVLPEHTRAGKPHDRPDLGPAILLVAMDRTFRAGRFFGTKLAAFQAQPGIVKEPLALRTEQLQTAVFVPAIQSDHRLDGFPLAREPNRRGPSSITWHGAPASPIYLHPVTCSGRSGAHAAFWHNPVVLP